MHRFFYIILVLGFIGCAGTKDVLKFKKEDVVFGLNKGACLGRCGVYNIEIYKNRYVVYEGLVNAERYGIFSKQLPKDEFNALKAAYESAKVMAMKDMYSIDIVDYPMITMTYSDGKAFKKIIGRTERPQALMELQYKLEKIGKNPDGWKLEKAYEKQITNEVTEERLEVKDNVIDSQIIIEPNSNTFLAQWFKKYTAYDVQLIKKLSPNSNYWLITYSKEKINAKEMLEMLKSDPEIKSAEFNKLISPREH